MIIAAAPFKALLKRLSAVKSDQVVLDTKNGRIYSRDQELEIVVWSPILKAPDNREQFVLTLNKQRLSAACAKLSGEMTFTPTDKSLAIQAKKAKFMLEAGKGKEPAQMPEAEEIVMDLKKLSGLLKFSAANAEANRASPFGGVVEVKTHLSIEEGEAIEYECAGISTGGNCLTVAKAAAEGGAVVPTTHFPLSAARALQDLSAETVSIFQTDSVLGFVAAEDGINTTIIVSKLAKKFPQYGAFIPSKFAFTSTIEVANLKEVVGSVASMVGQDGGGRDDGGAVLLMFKEGELTVKTIGNQNGAEDSTVYESDDLFDDLRTYSLKHSSLAAFVDAAKEKITFKGNGPKEPVVLESGNIKVALAATVVA